MIPRVLFFAPFGAWSVHTQVDAVLGAALKLRGADVCVVRCDGIYPACDLLAWSGASAKEHCAFCAGSGSKIFDSFDIPLVQLRAHLSAADFTSVSQWANALPGCDLSAAEWSNLPIGKWVKSSVFTYFRTTESGLARPEVQAVHRQFLETGVLTWLALSRIIERYQPARCVIFNGRMAPFRIALELARQQGIPVLAHERGGIDDSFTFYENANCLATQPVYDCVDLWREIPLKRIECEAVKEYLTMREHGKGLNYPSFYSYSTDYAAVRSGLRIPVNAKVLLVLTSSEFELATSEYSENICRQLDVLDALIEMFRNRDEFLVVRHHPNIAGSKDILPDYGFLARALRQASRLPPNVRIIMPSEAMSSYSLFWNADACIAFFTTASVEAAARGLATASFPDSLYRQAIGGVIDDTSIKGLDALVNSLFESTAGFGQADLCRVYRYIHAYITKVPKRFRSFGIKNHFEADLRLATVEELAPGHDEELDRVCKHLLTGASFWPEPSATDHLLDASEEDRFLVDQLNALKDQRQRVRRRSDLVSRFRLNAPVAIVRVRRTAAESGATSREGFLRVSRHEPVRLYECQLNPGATHPKVLESVLISLGQVEEEYVTFALDSAWQVESFLSTAVDQLLDDVDLALDGIFNGGWLSMGDGNVDGEIFTERVVCATYDEAVGLLPALAEPHAFLPFGLFRKSKLRPLLEETSRFSAAEPATRQLFDKLRQVSFRWTYIPTLILSRLKTG
jgi:hypothetical protein